MRCVSLNLDVDDVEALRQVIVAYLAGEMVTDSTSDALRSRLKMTLSELDAVLNRPASRRLPPLRKEPIPASAPQPHLRLVQSVKGRA